jgi:phosphopantetheinyl transferase (holo-ACP synthase)
LIGNDIIDLEVAANQSNWKRAGWLNKLFTKEEQALILESNSPEIEVWRMWAMKEAAWKAHQRRYNLPRRFEPRAIICTSEVNANSGHGTIRISKATYFSQITLGEDHIHCVVSMTKNTHFHPAIFRGNVDLKREFISNFSYFKGLSKRNIKIVKNENYIPVLTISKCILDANFSFSNHGKFSAYVF